MSNIRVRRFSSASSEGWEMDCFILPNDETNGELIDYKHRGVIDFIGKSEPGIFKRLDSLLNEISPGSKGEDVKMVVGRLKEDKTKIHYYLRAAESYSQNSSEAKLWATIDTIFFKRLERKV